MIAKTKKKILVLGGGFGGLEFCQQFKNTDVEIEIVDQKNHHLFQPLLYQVATCGLSGPQIAQPLRDILRKNDNTTTYLD